MDADQRRPPGVQIDRELAGDGIDRLEGDRTIEIDGIRRFDDFVDRLGISRNVLTNRLDTLVDAGILARRPYDEARGRSDYLLTEKGRALWPVITALRQWGDEWVYGPGNEPVTIEHKTCGHATTAQMTSDHCGDVLDARSVRAVTTGMTERVHLLR